MKAQFQFSFRCLLVLLMFIFLSVTLVSGQDSWGPVPINISHTNTYVTPAISKYAFSPAGNNIGPARAGAIIDYALIAPILVLGSAAAFSEDPDASTALGAAATVIASIGVPISELLGGTTRRTTGVRGSIPLRIVGWVGYGLTLVDAITMLALSEDVHFGPGLILPVAILGALSATCFGIDNSKTVSQAKSAQPKLTLSPAVRTLHDPYGHHFQTIGVRVNF
jgi:hypothetical protein